MSQERSSEDGEDEISLGEGLPGSVGPWWSRQLVASVAALALMATVTLVTIVESPLARAGSRPSAARTAQPLPVTTTTQASDYPAAAVPLPSPSATTPPLTAPPTAPPTATATSA
ncbi:hypothetical protein GA0115240_11001, partial [Streptomyces sp. DvalAA-14]